jgi:hypothetical protein
MHKCESLKIVRIRQSAAKPRTGEGSETIPISGVGRKRLAPEAVGIPRGDDDIVRALLKGRGWFPPTRCGGLLLSLIVCKRREMRWLGMIGKNLVGNRYGRWVVVGKADPITRNGNRKTRRWFCECVCGSERVVVEKSLLDGVSKSCGCYHSEIMKNMSGKINVTHGMSNTRLYGIWNHMKNRC